MTFDPQLQELINHEAARHLERESGLPLTFVRYRDGRGWSVAIKRDNNLHEFFVFDHYEEDGRPLINTAVMQEIKAAMREPDFREMKEKLWRAASDYELECEESDDVTIRAHHKLKKLYPRKMHDMPIFNLG